MTMAMFTTRVPTVIGMAVTWKYQTKNCNYNKLNTMKKVIYVIPDCWSSDDWSGYKQTEFERMTDSEKLKEARENEDMLIYSLEGFQDAFNGDEISDLGYIYIVHEDE